MASGPAPGHAKSDKSQREAKKMGELFRDDRLTRLYAYWRAKRDGKRAPGRADLDLAEISDLLPVINLIDVEWAPFGFRHRLVGAELIERHGRNARGRLVDATLYGPAAAEIHATLQRLTVEVRPFRRRARMDWNDRSWLTLEAVEPPLIDDTGRVNMILRGSSFSAPDEPSSGRLEYWPLPEP